MTLHCDLHAHKHCLAYKLWSNTSSWTTPCAQTLGSPHDLWALHTVTMG